MKLFDLMNLDSFPYEVRGKNVFYQADEFKARVIELQAGQTIPDCQMASHVIFYVVKGQVTITCNGGQHSLTEYQTLITEPAQLSMHSENGARLMGIQIKEASKG